MCFTSVKLGRWNLDFDLRYYLWTTQQSWGKAQRPEKRGWLDGKDFFDTSDRYDWYQRRRWFTIIFREVLGPLGELKGKKVKMILRSNQERVKVLLSLVWCSLPPVWTGSTSSVMVSAAAESHCCLPHCHSACHTGALGKAGTVIIIMNSVIHWAPLTPFDQWPF